MTTRRIEVRIGRDGSIEAETHGFRGAECLHQVVALEALLEAEAVDSEFTAEMQLSEVEQPARAEERLGR